MADRVSYYHATCPCGHDAYLATSRWVHRDFLLARMKCTGCGRRDRMSVTVILSPECKENGEHVNVILRTLKAIQV
jgi:hypothetical protein